jgi:hypothetical protein
VKRLRRLAEAAVIDDRCQYRPLFKRRSCQQASPE